MTTQRGPSKRVQVAAIGAGLIGAVAIGLLAVPPGPAEALPAPRFVDEAATSGLAHVYAGDYPWVVGGGLATFDCDRDRRPDVYIAGGTERASLFRNVSDVGGPLRFQAVGDRVTDLLSVHGAYPINLDGDDFTDLVVLRAGENVLLRGLGECRFERANRLFGLTTRPGWSVGFSATWEDEASLPTLAFGQFLVLDADLQPTKACDHGDLVRPAGDGRTYGPPIELSPGYCAQSVLFSDWDRSGRRDLRVSNDRNYYPTGGEEQLWRIEPGVAPRLYTREEGWARLVIWGMGIASQDVTGDGRPEVYLTSQGDNKLQTLADDATGPAFEDIALKMNATAHRPYAGDTDKQSTAWHPEFADVNNDGFSDLFVSKGNVELQADHAQLDPSNLLIGQADGTFAEGAEAAGIMRFGLGRGAALVDFNLDGLLDLVQVFRNESVALWRNVGAGTAEQPEAMGHWIALGLEQPGANRDAVGAWIEIQAGDATVVREVTVGGGHASGELGWIHVGLGAAKGAEVRVTWPDGEVGPWLHVDADLFGRVVRDAPIVEPWRP
jgi:enediyne biosynthesis protein E4